MENSKPPLPDLAARLQKAEGALHALKLQEADATMGNKGVMFLRGMDRIKQDRLAQRALEELLTARTALLDAALAQVDAEKDFHAMADAAPALIWVAGPDQARHWFNQSWLHFTGRAMGEELGSGWTENVHPEDLPKFLQVYADSFARRIPFEMEYRLRNADGNYRWVVAHGVPRRGPNGEFLGVIGCCADITPIKTVGDQLAAAKDAAEQANRAKSVFLAQMSHEIRTPMNAILGMAHLMRRDGVTPQQAERLDKIDTAAQHLLGIINDVLDLSKIEAGKLVPEDAEILVDDVVHNIASLLSPMVKARGLQLVVDVARLPGPLRGDATRLAQALLNFASNAVKFTAQGSVTLRSRLLDQTEATVLLRFEVEDTGIGIPAEHLDRLFAPFEQIDNTSTRAYGGTGLGLIITKRLAQLMGGDAGASSTPGAGSVFWFTACLKRGKAAHAAGKSCARKESADAILARDYRGRTVLLVEDDPLNREIALDVLGDTGLVVDTANDGLQAVAMAQANAYDLILMDMQMPKMEGLEATRRIRAIPGRNAVPILAMTANAFDEDRDKCLRAGMSDFLSKPTIPEHLFAKLLEWLRRAEMQASARTPSGSAQSLLVQKHGDKRLLLVDDCRDSRDLMRMLLGDIWPAIEVAADGAQALELATTRRYDLILMDLQMPGMDGLETTRRIRALRNGADTLILALTANSGPEDKAACIKAGMNDLVPKTLDADEPYATLFKWLERLPD